MTKAERIIECCNIFLAELHPDTRLTEYRFGNKEADSIQDILTAALESLLSTLVGK